MGKAIVNCMAFISHHISPRQTPQKSEGNWFSMNKLNSVLLLTFGLFAVLYLVQVNVLATKGYAIKDLEKKIALQKKENERFQMKIIEAQSIGRIQKKIEDMKLVRSEQIDYLTSSARTVAAR